MGSRATKATQSGFTRTILVGVCVVAHLALSTGFPIWKPSGPSSALERFPCERHRCGCQSAAQCWRSCCCKTMSEKLAWAKQNSVQPPNFVEVAAAQQSLELPSRSCCFDDDRESTGAGTESSCCRSHSPAGRPARVLQTVDSQSIEQDESTWVMGVEAQKCLGIALQWIASGAVLPAPPRVQTEQDMSTRALSLARESRLVSISNPPAVPPPRSA